MTESHVFYPHPLLQLVVPAVLTVLGLHLAGILGYLDRIFRWIPVSQLGYLVAAALIGWAAEEQTTSRAADRPGDPHPVRSRRRPPDESPDVGAAGDRVLTWDPRRHR